MLGIFFGGPWELVLILVVVLLLFGHRIPGMARSLGSGIVEFKKGLKSGEETPELPRDQQTTHHVASGETNAKVESGNQS